MDLIGPELVASLVDVLAGQGSSFGSGPGNAYVIPDTVDGDDLVLITGYEIDYTGVDLTTDNFLTDLWDIKTTNDEVNLQNNYYGVSTPAVGSGQLLIMDFTTDNLNTGTTFGGPAVNSIDIGIQKAATITWVAYDNNGNVVGIGEDVPVSKDKVIEISGDNNEIISFVGIYGVSGATGVVVQSVGTITNDGQADIVFEVVGTDGDGDISDPAVITVQVDGSGTLTGSAEGDVLSGGAGDQAMTGGTGADVFQWNLGDEDSDADPDNGIQPGSIDTITDFNQSAGGAYNATEGDVLDLSDLLVGEDTSDLVDLANYITVNDNGVDTTLSIDVDGSDDFVTPDQEIVLTGVTGVTLESLVVTDGTVVADSTS